MSRIHTAEPFALTSSPAAYVPREATERALAQLQQWVLRSNSDAVVLAGPPGMGKSLLLKVFAERIGTRTPTVYVPYPVLQPAELCAWALDALGEPRGDDPEARLAEVAASHRREGGLLLLIDDAMSMPPATARALPALSRASDGCLRWVLATSSRAEVVERVGQALGTETVTLDTPLNSDESFALLSAALERAGSNPESRALFDSATVTWLHEGSRGVPARLLAEAGRLLHARGEETEPSASPPPPIHLPVAQAPPERAPGSTERPAAQRPERPRLPRIGVAAVWAGSGLAAGVFLTLGLQALWGSDANDLHGALSGTAREDPPAASAPPPREAREKTETSESARPVSSAGEIGGEREAPEIAAVPVPADVPATELPGGSPAADEPAERTARAAANAKSQTTSPAEWPEPEFISNTGAIEQGGCLAISLSDQGIPMGVTVLIEREVGALFDFRRSRPGHSYRIVRTRSGELVDFRYLISPKDQIHLRHEDGRYTAERSSPATESSGLPSPGDLPTPAAQP